VVEQVAEALVRLLGRPEAGELPHRPEAAAVHRRVDARGEGIDAGIAELGFVVDLDRVGRVERVVLEAEIVEKSSPWRSGAASYSSRRHSSVSLSIPGRSPVVATAPS
jgi:hypothetical protein